MPDDLDNVAAVPLVEEFIVITLPEVPAQEKVPEIVWVVELVKVTVFGGLIVRLLKVLLPLIITAPVPAPVIEIAL